MNMRQGSRNDNGLVRIEFLYIRKRPAGLSEPGPFNKTGFFAPQPGPRAPPQNHKSHNIHVIFLAITAFSWKFSCHPNGCQDLTNQSV